MKLINIELSKHHLGDQIEIGIDFDDFIHHILVFQKGDARDLVVKRLRLFADILQDDERLDN
jgi:hypothetical protein